MALPLFYIEHIDSNASFITLNEDTSKHIVQVLRMQNREQLQLTNGKGDLFTVSIEDNNRKRCTVKIESVTSIPKSTNQITIAISPVKNNSRFEWFLEKATEIGVTEIIPLICDRTEKQSFKYDRMQNILVSAMLQSQQSWLPHLHEPVKFKDLMKNNSWQQKLIAHCEEDKKESITQYLNQSEPKLICIGPEGDFTNEEIQLALQNNFIPVTLGITRLRTETAGIVAATLLSIR